MLFLGKRIIWERLDRFLTDQVFRENLKCIFVWDSTLFDIIIRERMAAMVSCNIF